MSVIAEVARSLGRPVDLVLKAAVGGIHDGHRSPKHERYVGPKGRSFRSRLARSGLFFCIYQEVFESAPQLE